MLPSIVQEPFNLIDTLSEPAPSTSTACPNHCPPEKPKRVKPPKQDQSLIVFSSASSSEETVPQAKSQVAAKEVQCELGEERWGRAKFEEGNRYYCYKLKSNSVCLLHFSQLNRCTDLYEI